MFCKRLERNPDPSLAIDGGLNLGKAKKKKKKKKKKKEKKKKKKKKKDWLWPMAAHIGHNAVCIRDHD